MDFSVEDLCGLLKRSRLASSAEVHVLYDRWSAETTADTAAPANFPRWLVRQKVLTEYQAGLLAKGMVDDFFLGDYKILDRVGKGRMGGVYKAVHTDGRVVAIKVLPPSRTKIPAVMARFQREAKLAQSFDHPNVVRSLDVGETNGLHYFVMELLDGETVDDVLQRRKRLPPKEAANVIYQTLLGLQHLHEHGVVHRDLKPANLMLVPSRGPGEPDSTLGRTVKILDIGLARKVPDDPSQPEKLDPTEVTQEGVLLGTPDYLSPEQARDPRAIDIRSDIYSLGCVLYHLLAGQTPFPDSNILNLMIRHATEQPRPLRELVPEIPEALQQIVTLMIAKLPAYRYPTPAHVAAALRIFLDGPEAFASASPFPNGSATTSDSQPAGTSKPAERGSQGSAVRKSGKFPAPPVVSRSQRESSPLPEHIELVPIAPAPQPAFEDSPFAADDAADDDTVVFRRRVQPKRNVVPIVVAAGVAIVLGAVGLILSAMARGR